MRLLLCSLILCTAISGCGGGVSDAPETVPVSGTVTFDGQPLAGASVVFTPDQGKIATGVTSSEGVYELKTAATDGAMAGTYTVTISPGGETPMPGTPEAENLDPDAALPAKYGDPKTSGLTATVSADSGPIDFALSKE